MVRPPIANRVVTRLMLGVWVQVPGSPPIWRGRQAAMLPGPENR